MQLRFLFPYIFGNTGLSILLKLTSVAVQNKILSQYNEFGISSVLIWNVNAWDPIFKSFHVKNISTKYGALDTYFTVCV